MDDTLLGWSQAEQIALEQAFRAHLVPEGTSLQAAWAGWRQMLEANHAAFLRTGRWWYARDRLEHLIGTLPATAGRDAADQDVLVAALEATFRAVVAEEVTLLAGAKALLSTLRDDGVPVGVLTNGPGAVQRKKIERTGLDRLVDHVAISGEIGHWKPDPAAFHHVLQALDATAEGTVMVGDHVHFDITPAKRLGMQTVWVDPAGRRHEDADHVVAGPDAVLGLW